MAKTNTTDKLITALTHTDDTRRNIPTAEYQSMLQKEAQNPLRVAYERRNRDLDPQLVWRGKDEQDWSDLMVAAPPLYIQEKVHPKALIDDLLRQSKIGDYTQGRIMADLFADFNGIPQGVDKTEFYQHDQHWTNRMILGDSLQVMASLAEREGLRGKVQCIYFDPPYGIKFNSNFQWSTTSRDVKDGNAAHITREPEQVKAFRDTWRDGIHSYLTYLRDRLTVARDLLTDSGSVFVQIGDENVHRVRALMDEVFGDENFVSQIVMKTTGGLGSSGLKGVSDFILWYAKDHESLKFRKALLTKQQGEGASTGERYSAAYETNTGIYRTLTSQEKEDSSKIPPTIATFQYDNLVSSGYTPTCTFPIEFESQRFTPGGGRSWKTNEEGVKTLIKAGRIGCTGKSVRYRRFLLDYPGYEASNIWMDIAVRTDKQYVVETSTGAIQRCLLMASDPGDLILDPTCGSGTTAYVAEQWGRRWITIDTSRVALALARTRLMGARYPFYLLADSQEGQKKEAEITRSAISTQPTRGNIRHGFVYERVPHITLKSIANNAEIDVIYDKWQSTLEPLRAALNAQVGQKWEEWEIPREAKPSWSAEATQLHGEWWQARIARQKEIDASIAAKAEFEYLYDKPYEDKRKVRVAGPFTVESLSPHRTLGVDEEDNLIDPLAVQESKAGYGGERTFEQMILENLKSAGVQQAHKEDKINFTSLTGWPGDLICAEGRYQEGERERRAGIFIGPEFGTIQRADLVQAARECADAGFDVLIACAFNFEAHTTDFNKLGGIPVLKARMNADLHMAEDLKNTGKGNLFVVFGEPDIDLLPVDNGQIQVRINGVDVFHPSTGEVRSDGAEGIACWFIDTDYNEESFFVRHAYFLGANDPYKALKTTLKAEINAEAWESLNSDTSRPFPKPTSGRIAVKVINHLGDEVMKVFRVA
ncbi:site-specific DNA-methyltransferase [Rudanella lutea]|uniref:site-specific DNA-methyltransferase n=1 Tax=Rudanella lutea TaxID=451374 RepID=UPI00036C2839|nr:site-specific DNA-methyltransferase [Rudanella lutea]